MTLRQEAFQLLLEQPEKNLQIIVDLLKLLHPVKTDVNAKKEVTGVHRVGVGKDIIHLPEDFFEHFDDSNDEIEAMFYGGVE